MGCKKMLVAVSFSKPYYNENEKLIGDYLKEKLDDDETLFIKNYDELPDEVLVQFHAVPDLFLDIINHFLFDTSISAIGSLVVFTHELFYREMKQYGYLDKEITTNYRTFNKDEICGPCTYVVFDLSQYRYFEKFLNLAYYYYCNWDYDESDESDDENDEEIDENKCSLQLKEVSESENNNNIED
jgi:hypothetical protein